MAKKQHPRKLKTISVQDKDKVVFKKGHKPFNPAKPKTKAQARKGQKIPQPNLPPRVDRGLEPREKSKQKKTIFGKLFKKGKK